MKIFRSLAQLPPDFGPVVATIGNFDGVHCGHRWVIGQVRQRAIDLRLPALAITFDPHPVRVLRPELPHSLITPLEQKLELFASTGLDATLVLPFDDELSRLSAESFTRAVLCGSLHVKEVHEGENFRFGYGATVDIHGLAQLGQSFEPSRCFTTRAYPPLILRGGPVSSSRIRNLIGSGNVSAARTLLGRPFAVRSTPASGRGLGTLYTVPTINLAAYNELLPGHGVYVTTLRIADELFEGVTNIGNRPTFGEDSFTVETHLLNFHPVVLEEHTPLELTFLLYLRAEQRWPDSETLRSQIMKDVAHARRYFALSDSLTCGA